jgi:hypothetical protein
MKPAVVSKSYHIPVEIINHNKNSKNICQNPNHISGCLTHLITFKIIATPLRYLKSYLKENAHTRISLKRMR